MTAMPALETPRLRVRPLTVDDAEEVNRVLNSAWGESSTVNDRAAWLDWTVSAYEGLASVFQPPYGDRAVVERATGHLVGVAGLVPSWAPFGRLPSFGSSLQAANRPELGLYWAVERGRQGKGYATEAATALIGHAFTQMGAHAVVATTEHDNHASLAVMRKLGMSIERNPLSEPPWFQACGVLRNPSGVALVPVLTTARLVLRPFRIGDEDEVWAYQRDPEQYRYIQWDLPGGPEDSAGFVRRCIRPDSEALICWAIQLDGRVVGDIRAETNEAKRAAEIGYTVGQAFKGQGIASEAAAAVVAWLFIERGLDQVYATADARNLASCRVLEKAGLLREGTRRGARLTRGERSDEAVYGVLREDWEPR
jgi:RimJ/RimL family protein N-acetyltransferase